MEDKNTSGEASSGRRRSARYLDKERPCFAPVRKPKRKRNYVKKVSNAPQLTSEPNGSMAATIVTDVSGEEVRGNGFANCNISVEDIKEVSTTSEHMRKLHNSVSGEAAQVGDQIRTDPDTEVVKSDHQKVKETLRVYNTYYLKQVQEEEKRVKEIDEKNSQVSKPKRMAKKGGANTSNRPAKSNTKELKNGADAEGDLKRAAKRPDLKAVTMMRNNKQILYPKMIGHLPGIDVGDQFFSRAEMCALGLHGHWLNGIDYMNQLYAEKEEYKNYTFPLAVCIVLSGMYEDDLDNSEDIIYTGQGGHDLLGGKHQISDQKMVGGNLALKHNFETGVPVRVIRGHKSKSSYTGKVYTYDGLYKVVEYCAAKGVSKFTVFKYKLSRVEGQASLRTNQVQFTHARAPRSISEVHGLVSEDISGSQENFPIPATNTVDTPPFPPKDFEYDKSIRLAKNLNLPTSAVGCKCEGECTDPRTCACAKLNGGDFPYVRKDGGRLIKAKAVVIECGTNCRCSKTCVNRTSQKGLKYRLEVFRTTKKGWAVRSWDTIPSGAPVCEYTGVLTRNDEIDTIIENNYIFDIDCLQTIKGLDRRETRPGDMPLLENFDDQKAEPEFCIDAGRIGNIARFINHSCDPNLFVQCVLSSHHDIKMAKVMLFAADTIPPLQELCYDYGYPLDSVVRPDGSVVELPCFCGAAGCRRRLH